jgi:hypothetical protein
MQLPLGYNNRMVAKTTEPTGATDSQTISTPTNQSSYFNKPFKMVGYILAALLVTVLLLSAYVYVASPQAVRKPKLDHYHFRMQILVNGKAENFADPKYQVTYVKDQCTADLPEQPIHFHDNKDQFVHIHWQDITGGMVLKYYGWNYISGLPDALGYRFDKTPPKKVPIHSNDLPTVPKDANFHVYIGDEHGYVERNFADFKNQKLEQFFGKTSNFPGRDVQSSFLNWLVPKATAHGTEDHSVVSDINETQEEKLTRINNLIGNVVIFVQKDRPTDQQIQDRFNRLEPLSESTCGG